MARLELAVCFDAGVPAVRRRGGRPPRWLPINLHFTNVYVRQSLGSQIHEKHEPEPPPRRTLYSHFLSMLWPARARSLQHTRNANPNLRPRPAFLYSQFLSMLWLAGGALDRTRTQMNKNRSEPKLLSTLLNPIKLLAHGAAPVTATC